MNTAIDTHMLALHGLAVKKAGPADAVAGIMGLDRDECEAALNAARDAGRVIEAKGTYMLTPLGRGWLDEQYPTVCARLRTDDRFVGGYEEFEDVNRDILDLFTRWQTITVGGATVANDHTDEDYDNGIIDELGDIHERSLPVIESFTMVEPRFSVYRDKLGEAYDKVLAGEKDWVSGARIESYHTLWFELHEDLLRLLGRQRTES